MAKSSVPHRGQTTRNQVRRLVDRTDIDLRSARMQFGIAQKRIESINLAMQQLEEAGMVNATPHYQQGKYLYLVHPQRNGHRVRDYIGSDHENIDLALAKIKRYQEHQALAKHLAELVAWLYSLQSGLPSKLPEIQVALQELLPLSS